MYDYIVVGCGFAGAVIAERIATQLDKTVLVMDKRTHLGGNCYDYRDENGIIVHKYGPHLFHTDNRDVFDYLTNYTHWQAYQHKVLASIDGQKVPIPFNFNTIDMLFPADKAEILRKKLSDGYGEGAKIPILELKKSGDADMRELADYVYDKVFVNYTAKQWGMKPEDMDGAVTARVPVFAGRDDRYFNDTYQAVPKYGYSEIFSRMLEHNNIRIMLNTAFRDVMNITDDGFTLFGSEFSGKVIYTGPIDELFGYRFGDLPYRSVDMKFETLEMEYFQETGTVNYPNEHEYTRITEFKRIHPAQTEKTTILKEYPIPHDRDKNIPYYPIFTEENQKRYNEYVREAAKYKNLTLLGRLAEYKYYDMDDIVARALNVFETEIR